LFIRVVASGGFADFCEPPQPGATARRDFFEVPILKSRKSFPLHHPPLSFPATEKYPSCVFVFSSRSQRRRSKEVASLRRGWLRLARLAPNIIRGFAAFVGLRQEKRVPLRLGRLGIARKRSLLSPADVVVNKPSLAIRSSLNALACGCRCRTVVGFRAGFPDSAKPEQVRLIENVHFL